MNAHSLVLQLEEGMLPVSVRWAEPVSVEGHAPVEGFALKAASLWTDHA